MRFFIACLVNFLGIFATEERLHFVSIAILKNPQTIFVFNNFLRIPGQWTNFFDRLVYFPRNSALNLEKF